MKRKPNPPPPPEPTRATAALDAAEQQRRSRLARSAQAKLSAGEHPSREESRALRSVQNEAVRTYGAELVANYPKGEFCTSIGRAPKVVIELFRRFQIDSYFAHGKDLNLLTLTRQLFDLVIENGDAILRRRRRVALVRDGDADSDELTADAWETRRLRAVTLLKEAELERELGRYVELDLLEMIARALYEGELRSMIDDYDRRSQVTGTEVAARLRLILNRMENIVASVLDENGTFAAGDAAELPGP